VNGVSIVICCHDSSTRLPITLHHVAKQVGVDQVPWEVVVVDNASRDETAVVAQREWARLGSPAPLTVVDEPEAGLVHARRRGVTTARYEYVAFVDDDNWIGQSFVRSAFDIMRSDETVGAAGGPAEPVFENGQSPPAWFYTYAWAYAVGAQAPHDGDVSQRGHVWGAGMVLKAPWLRQLYAAAFPFSLTGRSGGALLSGDDTEICKLYLIAGYRLHYDDRLGIRHLVPSPRLRREYCDAIMMGHEQTRPVLDTYDAWLRLRRPYGSFGWRAPRSPLRRLVRYYRAYKALLASDRTVARRCGLADRFAAEKGLPTSPGPSGPSRRR
jgi:glycosyltransferase involved in cell wall biosynthesis